MRTTSNPLWEKLQQLPEDDLRQNVLVPILRRIPTVRQVTDVHGVNERGLDIIFSSEDGVRKNWYGLQLKRGDISGGGSGNRTVKTIIDQLTLAKDFKHPVHSPPAGEYNIDYFIVATSGRISGTARDEIVRRVDPIPVEFWDLSEIVRRAKEHMPEVLQTRDAELADYLKAFIRDADTLDSLDQIAGVAKHSLSDVFVEPFLRRRLDPNVANDPSQRNKPGTFPALDLRRMDANAVIIGEQDEGKTTILRMIGVSQATDILEANNSTTRYRIPVFLRAHNVLRQSSLSNAVASALNEAGAGARGDALQQSENLGDYLILLDGFSELPNEHSKGQLANIVNTATSTDGTQVIITGRPDDFLRPQYFDALQQFNIQSFNQNQVNTLVRNWTKDLVKWEDVAERLVGRIREALQLPGSPIPAIIGVMLYEKERKFITNTADAVDRYMVIRLGRYAHEMGLPFEVDWARKQDLLGEVAFRMVEEGLESISSVDAETLMANIYARLGEKDRSRRAIRELVDAGVLLCRGDEVLFYRTAFRDFFAAHHLNNRGSGFEDFFANKLFDRKWGHTLVFAAGLRRRNSELLVQLNAQVETERVQLNVNGGEDFLYGAYLLGRILSNSEFSDHTPRKKVLHTTVRAAGMSADLLGDEAAEQFGNIGRVVALVGTEHTLFVSVGVPWLEQQIRSLCGDSDLTEDERYLIASLYTNLGCEDWVEVFREIVRIAESPRVVAALMVSSRMLDATRKPKGKEAERWRKALLALDRKVRRYGTSIAEVMEVKNKVLEMERKRFLRLQGGK